MPTLQEELTANPENPRTITPEKLETLRRTLAHYGDLSGIIRNTHESAADHGSGGVLIGGHQRVQALESDPNARVVVEKRYETPTPTGTTAEGYVLAHGERFMYREVAWPREKAIAAAIACNKGAGAWSEEGLERWMVELQQADMDLDMTLFDSDERAAYLPDEADMAALESLTAPEPQQGAEEVSFLTNPNQPVAAHVKQVQLFYDEKDHADFIKLTDELRSIHGHDNLSDTVYDAIKRAAISAAIG